MKTCIKCGQNRPLSEFYRNPKMRDGHFNRCKCCCAADQRRNKGRHALINQFLNARVVT